MTKPRPADALSLLRRLERDLRHARVAGKFASIHLVAILLAALALVFIVQAMHGRHVVSASDQQALQAARAKMRSSHPEAAPGFALVTLNIDSLTDMMEQDVGDNQAYLGWVRAKQGDSAAQNIEKAIRAPYLRRIENLKANGGSEELSIPVVTLWDSLTFSARSYDPSLGPMDPVSVVFFGEGSADAVYSDMTGACAPTDGCTRTGFQDDRGFDIQSGAYQCPSSTQWVLMGNADETLSWRPSVHGLMRAGDNCTVGTRNHMRVFGAKPNRVFGAWSVGTPHKEQWLSGPARFGHMIQAWTDARDAFSAFWLSGAPTDSLRRPARVAYSGSFNWGNSGIYQNVPFDGQGVAIELCSCP